MMRVLRKRKTLTDSEPTSSSSTFQPVIRKEFYDDHPDFNYDVWKNICDFVHPFLIHLLRKPPSSESSSSTNVIPLLPIELLISWNDRGILEEFKHVLLSYNFRKTLASKVARFGNYQTMMWFQSNGLTLNESVLVSAAQRGDIQLFERIWNDCSLDYRGQSKLIYDAFEGAAQFGHLDFLIFTESKSMLRLENKIGTSVLLQAASKNVQLKIFQKQQTVHCICHQRCFEVFFAAVSGNKMNVLVWFKSFLDEKVWAAFVRVSVRPYVSIAARHGNKDMVMWLIDQGFHSDQNSATAAATGGSIDLLKYFSHLWSAHVYTKAAEKGHLALLQWAKENAENNYPWPESKMFPAAAKCDNVELYQWLFDQQFPFEEEKSFINALRKGHFKLIKFARSKGSIFWNDEFYFSLLEGAATLGDLETMKWAIAENTGTTGTAANHASDFFVPVIEAAASGGHIHILEYLRPNDNMEVFYETVTRVAARHGHVAILEWVSENTDFIWAYLCFLAAIEGSQFKVLVWLQEFAIKREQFHDLMKRPHPMLMAAQVGDIEVFKWLRNNGMKWHPMTYAVAKNSFHDDIAEWALKNGCPKDKHARGKISLTSAIQLELSMYDKVDEPLQEEDVNYIIHHMINFDQKRI